MHLLQSGVAFSVIALWLGHDVDYDAPLHAEANLEGEVKSTGPNPENQTRKCEPPAPASG